MIFKTTSESIQALEKRCTNGKGEIYLDDFLGMIVENLASDMKAAYGSATSLKIKDENVCADRLVSLAYLASDVFLDYDSLLSSERLAGNWSDAEEEFNEVKDAATAMEKEIQSLRKLEESLKQEQQKKTRLVGDENEIRKKIAEREARIDELETLLEQKNGLEAEIRDLAGRRIPDARMDIQDAEGQIERLKKQLFELENEWMSKLGEVRKEKKQIQATEEERTKEYAREKKSLEDLQNQLDELEQAAERTRTDYSDTVGRMKAAEDEKRALEEKIGDLEAAIRSAKSECDNLRISIDVAETRKARALEEQAEWQSAYEAAITDTEDAEEKRRQIKEKAEALRNRLEQIRADIKVTEGSIRDGEKEEQSLNETYRADELALDRIRDAIKDAKEMSKVLRGKIIDAESEKTTAENDRIRLQSQYTGVANVVETILEDIRRMKEDLLKKQGGNGELQKELDQVTEQFNKAKTREKELKASIERMNSEIPDMDYEIRKLTQQAESLRTQYDDAVERINKARGDYYDQKLKVKRTVNNSERQMKNYSENQDAIQKNLERLIGDAVVMTGWISSTSMVDIDDIRQKLESRSSTIQNSLLEERRMLETMLHMFEVFE